MNIKQKLLNSVSHIPFTCKYIADMKRQKEGRIKGKLDNSVLGAADAFGKLGRIAIKTEYAFRHLNKGASS